MHLHNHHRKIPKCITLDELTISRLSSSKLCNLVTLNRAANRAKLPDHVTCMTFTHHMEDEGGVRHSVLIMTTQSSSNKVYNLRANPQSRIIANNCQPNIDVGINDTTGRGLTWSVTLHCQCSIVAENLKPGSEFMRYRNIHLQSNPGYRDFILAKNNALLLFRVQACDLQEGFQREDTKLQAALSNSS